MRLKHLVVACVLLGGSLAHASANLIVNGGFENGLNGWTGTATLGNSNPYFGEPFAPYEGNSFATINAYGADGTDPERLVGDTLSQTFVTTPGKQYKVSFEFASFIDGAANPPSTLDFKLNDQIHGTQTLSPYGGNPLWQSASYTFVADSTHTTLTFGNSSQAVAALGASIDNVQVSAVPEPQTWAMLGIGMAGVLMLRRRSV